MKNPTSQLPKRIFSPATLGALGTILLLTSCATVSTKDIKPIKIDGSSTVAPITEKVVEAYKANPSNKAIKEIPISANISGTGGGFKKFCAAETDISGASRPILVDEMKACKEGKVSYIELPVAFDAITVVVNPQNTWAQDITVEELRKLWQASAERKVTRWNQIRPSWPDRPITLHGPGKDSGTYDYFNEVIIGEKVSRGDYNFSENDDALVQAVSQDPNALGYFGYSYYERNKDKLKALGISHEGNPPVLPSRETVEAAQYRPLARPLFIYVNAKAAQDNPALEEFVEFYLNKAPELVKEIGEIPLPEEGYHLGRIQFQKFEAGTVFDGKPQYNLTIGELLRKQATFEPTKK
jgi:phosphate transport system substrate-binding protein